MYRLTQIVNPTSISVTVETNNAFYKTKFGRRVIPNKYFSDPVWEKGKMRLIGYQIYTNNGFSDVWPTDIWLNGHLVNGRLAGSII